MRKRAKSQHIDVRFDRELDPGAIAEAWEDDLRQAVVPGKLLDEFVFFHDSSKTLIVTDTLQNFDLEKLPQPARTIVWAARAHAPHARIPADLRLAFLFDKGRIRKAVEEMLSWQPQRIILSHGKKVGHDAPAVLRFAFRFALRRGILRS